MQFENWIKLEWTRIGLNWEELEYIASIEQVGIELDEINFVFNGIELKMNWNEIVGQLNEIVFIQEPNRRIALNWIWVDELDWILERNVDDPNPDYETYILDLQAYQWQQRLRGVWFLIFQGLNILFSPSMSKTWNPSQCLGDGEDQEEAHRDSWRVINENSIADCSSLLHHVQSYLKWRREGPFSNWMCKGHE